MNHRRLINFAISLAMVFVLAIATLAICAEPVIVSGTVQSVTQATDKNGSPYVRAIVGLEKKLSGVSYTDSVPFMFFGPSAQQGESLEAGAVLKCIAKPREYQGRTSYTVLKLLE